MMTAPSAHSLPLLLVVVVVAACSIGYTSALPQQAAVGDDGRHVAPSHRWVWGRKEDPSTQPPPPPLPVSVAAVGAAAVVPRAAGIPPASAQRRHGKVIDDNNNSGRGVTALDTNHFKSITARSFPSAHPHNVLDVKEDDDKQTKSDAGIRPPPVDTTFRSHFDVISNTEVLKEDHQDELYPLTVPALITPGEYPYPFNAQPIDLGDGTSIGWAPEDTLLVQGGPSVSNGHSTSNGSSHQQELDPPKFGEEHDARYTTLDKLFDSRAPTKLPDTNTLSNDMLGGLHPDEVYYADKDILIIKGGHFAGRGLYHDGEDEIDQSSQNRVKPAPVGNELGEANDPRVTNVRPDELFSKVPLAFRFVNGNIATIVRPTASSPQQRQFSNRQQRTSSQQSSHTFRPLHQTSFSPISSGAPTGTNFYAQASSRRVPSFSAPDSPNSASQNYQALGEDDEEDEMLAQASSTIVHRVQAPAKRAAEPTDASDVVSYHYQTRGTGSNAYPIVDYKIHSGDGATSGSASTRGNQAAAPRIQNHNNNQNNVPLASREIDEQQRVTKRQPQNSQLITSAPATVGQYDELEDLNVPATGNHLIPQTQVPRRHPTRLPATSPQSQTATSGGQFVPSTHQFPQQGQQGSIQPTGHQAPGGGFQQQGPLQQQSNNRGPERRPPTFQGNPSSHLDAADPSINLIEQHNPVSLAGDTRVNFLHPRPGPNNLAEFLVRGPDGQIVAVPAVSPPQPAFNTRTRTRVRAGPAGQRAGGGAARPGRPVFIRNGNGQVSGVATRQQGQFIPVNPPRQGPHNNVPQQQPSSNRPRRFMEPRRRQSLQPRQTPRV